MGRCQFQTERKGPYLLCQNERENGERVNEFCSSTCFNISQQLWSKTGLPDSSCHPGSDGVSKPPPEFQSLGCPQEQGKSKGGVDSAIISAVNLVLIKP